MSIADHKALVQKINAAFERNDVEAFLAEVHDDFEWTMVGDTPLGGKDTIREFMKQVQGSEPPRFSVDALIADGDMVACVGNMSMPLDGEQAHYGYCDVWRFRDGKPASLKAFVIRTDGKK